MPAGKVRRLQAVAVHVPVRPPLALSHHAPNLMPLLAERADSVAVFCRVRGQQLEPSPGADHTSRHRLKPGHGTTTAPGCP
jgi:hypothetical protein